MSPHEALPTASADQSPTASADGTRTAFAPTATFGPSVAPTEAKFLTAGEDGATAIWDAATLKKVIGLEGASRCWLWNYSPDGRWIAGTGANSVVAIGDG